MVLYEGPYRVLHVVPNTGPYSVLQPPPPRRGCLKHLFLPMEDPNVPRSNLGVLQRTIKDLYFLECTITKHPANECYLPDITTTLPSPFPYLFPYNLLISSRASFLLTWTDLVMQGM